MFLIGLTGGIASGKSTVAKLLAKNGAYTIDADQVARDVVEVGSPGLAAVVEEFGSDVLSGGGQLDRERLGSIVFSDPEKRLKLESILHPLIKVKTMQQISESDSEIVVYAVPLLVEASVDYPFDFIVTVEAGEDNQLERLVRSRGLSQDQAKERIASQASREQRQSKADFVIDSSGTLEQLANQVDALWLKIEATASGDRS
jgi:dephospho-CoA kinase